MKESNSKGFLLYIDCRHNILYNQQRRSYITYTRRVGFYGFFDGKNPLNVLTKRIIDDFLKIKDEVRIS